MQTNLEQTILRNILTDENFMRKVLPFIKPDYFEGIYRILFREAGKFVAKYNKLPTYETFKIELDQSDRLSGENYTVAVDIIPQLFTKEPIDEQWLLDTTEKWCQDRAIYNAIMESISIIDGKHESLTKGALPDLLSKALGVAFDTVDVDPSEATVGMLTILFQVCVACILCVLQCRALDQLEIFYSVVVQVSS